ncbi:hypothetical protein [Rhizobium sp. NFR03]|uniref:DUF6894 family protein n=1 Tax=Rhizobium sp. NFR03 TaxID=1566263 RepID=UPI0008B7DBAD|nr:hypothetical protein [Rhizobium sp. NFR03]SES22533.1 hypothetical protein SAMN03159406_02798 [Rhizobium sp. NFR03]
MTEFYFNIVTAAGTILDDEGTDLRDLDIAQTQAVKDVRALMSDAILGGRDISGRVVEICDSSGEVLRTVPFMDTFTRES